MLGWAAFGDESSWLDIHHGHSSAERRPLALLRTVGCASPSRDGLSFDVGGGFGAVAFSGAGLDAALLSFSLAEACDFSGCFDCGGSSPGFEPWLDVHQGLSSADRRSLLLLLTVASAASFSLEASGGVSCGLPFGGLPGFALPPSSSSVASVAAGFNRLFGRESLSFSGCASLLVDGWPRLFGSG